MAKKQKNNGYEFACLVASMLNSFYNNPPEKWETKKQIIETLITELAINNKGIMTEQEFLHLCKDDIR
jgi:hypothetical protein